MKGERKKMWKKSMGDKEKTLKTSTDEWWVPISGDDGIEYDFIVEPTQEDLEKAKKKRKIWITQ